MVDHEEMRKKEHFHRMQQGSLTRHVEAPFIGKSTSQRTFIDHHKANEKLLIKPIDEVKLFINSDRCLCQDCPWKEIPLSMLNLT